MIENKLQRPVALLLFFFSGFVSLIFQVVWLKMLVLVFGNTVWASSTLLTAFMAGLAIGSWLFGRIADRTKSSLRLYGIIEGIIGVYAVLTPLIFSKLYIIYTPINSITGGNDLILGMFKFLIGFIILLPPTICMGGTLPLLAKHFTKNIDKAGSKIGSLYTINTFGAVLGTFIAGFFLIPLFGLKATIFLGSIVNLMILLISFIITRGETAGFSKYGLFKISFKKIERNWVVWVYFVLGFASLSYEIIWNRILVLHIGSSVYAYAVMLGVYLLGITLGAGFMSHYIEKVRKPILVFVIIQFVIAFDLIILINQFAQMPHMLVKIGEFIGLHGYFSHTLAVVFATFQILILPTFLFGASFPLAARLFIKNKEEVGKETGQLYAFNTVGCIFGSFLAGFVFLPFLGAQISLLLTGSINLLIGIYLFARVKNKIKKKVIVSLSILIFFYLGYFGLTSKDQVILSAGVFKDEAKSKVKLLDYNEDVYATVSVEQRSDVRGTWKQLSMNGVNVAGTSVELFYIQKMQGHLPLLLNKSPKKVLHIGFGSGGTAWAVSRYPVKEIVIAEISRSVIEKASKYFKCVNHGVLKDPRVKVEFTDGRNKILVSKEKYDVILSDSVHPRFSGNGSLYTYEYYKLLKTRLNPGGLVSQWLPFYSITPENFKMILKSFYKVFPNTSIWFINSTFNDYVIVIGKLDGPMIDFSTICSKLKIPEVAEDLKEINCENPYKILDFFFFANEKVGEFVGDVPIHTDDSMSVEYMSGRALDKHITALLNYSGLLKYRTSVKKYLINLNKAPENRKQIIDTINRYEFATYFNLYGQILFREGKRLKAFKTFDKIPIYNSEDLEPVEYFGSSYQKPFLRKARLN